MSSREVRSGTRDGVLAPVVERRQYATVPDAAAYVRLAPKTIREMIRRGELTGYRYRRNVLRVDLGELDRLLAGEAS